MNNSSSSQLSFDALLGDADCNSIPQQGRMTRPC